jgi:hypothetical protein
MVGCQNQEHAERMVQGMYRAKRLGTEDRYCRDCGATANGSVWTEANDEIWFACEHGHLTRLDHD